LPVGKLPELAAAPAASASRQQRWPAAVASSGGQQQWPAAARWLPADGGDWLAAAALPHCGVGQAKRPG